MDRYAAPPGQGANPDGRRLSSYGAERLGRGNIFAAGHAGGPQCGGGLVGQQGDMCHPLSSYGRKPRFCARFAPMIRTSFDYAIRPPNCSTPVTPCANTTARNQGDGNCFPNGAVKSRQKHRSAHWRIKTILWLKRTRFGPPISKVIGGTATFRLAKSQIARVNTSCAAYNPSGVMP